MKPTELIDIEPIVSQFKSADSLSDNEIAMSEAAQERLDAFKESALKSYMKEIEGLDKDNYVVDYYEEPTKHIKLPNAEDLSEKFDPKTLILPTVFLVLVYILGFLLYLRYC